MLPEQPQSIPQPPLVTVLVCVYNAGPYLRPAVDSVLQQTHRNLEVLVVNDGSTDGCIHTVEDVSDPRLRIIHQANAGKPTAMNRALDEMRGAFYAIQDADDLSHPRRVERQVAAMLENPDVAAAFCGHEVIVNGRHMAPLFHRKDQAACGRDIAAYRMPAHDPTAMYRMEMVRDLRYDPSLTFGEGLEYMLRVGERWPMIVVDECLYSYRIHHQSLTKRDPDFLWKQVYDVLRRACERRGEDFAARFPQAGRPVPKFQREDNGLAAHFMESVCDLKRAGRRWEAIKTGLHCARMHALDPHYLKALVYALTPRSLVTGSRRAAPAAPQGGRVSTLATQG